MQEHHFTSQKKSILKPLSSGNGPTLFQLEDVSVKYGNFEALKNIKLKIQEGEIVFITGASGAGKTTLLKVLAGFVNPTSGRSSSTAQKNKHLFISNIFQDQRFLENKSCHDNLRVAYDKGLYRNRKEFEDEILEFAKVLGIYDRLNLKISQANGGLKQKVAFIRALLARPDVLIADEPTSSLDFENSKKLFEVLSLYNTKQGLTVIWASHNKDLVKKFTGRILHLDKGRLIYTGHACFI